MKAHKFNIDMEKELFGFSIDDNIDDAKKILEERRVKRDESTRIFREDEASKS